ncbi:hypothetical protein [Geomicrobium sp. JCM 19055]|uniref:hypothetical protein n=1 Tax=Geomicrobium sp. JCM 19055 TaxID=1460649 RepID=UPI00045EDBBF|nr:hypothetical protein [Geomicrobium sp. JCM 19055]GAK00705.1 hypothetical protein JCM19055_3815 [Geomicrobium sp. JCM 19055]
MRRIVAFIILFVLFSYLVNFEPVIVFVEALLQSNFIIIIGLLTFIIITVMMTMILKPS